MWRELSTEAMRPGAKPEAARLAVITGLVRATGSRYGDLLRVRVEDIDLGPARAKASEGSVLVRHGTHRTPHRHLLPADLVVLLKHWMVVPLSCVWCTVSSSARGTEPSSSAASSSRTTIQCLSSTTRSAGSRCR